MNQRKSLYLVDAANILFRAYYAIGPMSNAQGTTTGALFGFIRTILKLIETLKPDYMSCVFDGPNNKKQRQEIYEHYKSHRAKMPDDLYPQLQLAVDFCKMKGLNVYMLEGVEADDTIGSIASWADKENLDVYICSSDKDLCQLVSDHIKVVHLHKENLIVDKHKVEEIYGVKPGQIIDLLALMGDTSDNIPGVEGVGPKTASSWIHTYNSIDGLYEHLDQLPAKKQELLKNSKDIVKMSQKLATIIKDVKFNQDIASFEIQQEDSLRLKELYQSMQFYSLLKTQVPEQAAEFQYSVIKTLKELDQVIAEQKKAKVHVIDLETTSVNPMDAEIVGLSLCDEKKHIYYIPFNLDLKKNEIIKKLKELENLSWTGHNIKYDFRVLKNLDIELPLEFDTMLASYLITPHQPKHNLDILSLEHFGVKKISYESLVGSKKNAVTLDQVDVEKVAAYCSEDAFMTLKLRDLFQKKMKELDLEHVFYDIEMPLIPVLARMENKGIFVDKKYLKELSVRFKHKSEELEKLIFHEAGQEFNISSPKQLSHVLFDILKIKPLKKTQTGYSTSADVLESLQEEAPFVKHILEYRTYEKLRNTYTDALIEQINPYTHRIHCTFNQSVTATGRLSSQDPNLQNIPVKTDVGKLIRSAFIPEHNDCSFVALDYSQIELRLLAHMSEDPILVEAFKHHQDIHARTAAEVFGVPLEEVTPQMRQKAKAVNFGILYGQQAFGLSQGLNLSFSEAKEFIEKYFHKYRKVKDFLESQKEFAKKNGYSQTLTGRKRPIPDITAKNPMVRSAAERLAINTPLQGTAADLIKLAMIGIDKKLYTHKEPLGDLLLQIHDELIFECPDNQTQTLAQLAKYEMEHVFKLKVPLIVDISIGKNWGEC
jgi:DNA polymerase-1